MADISDAEIARLKEGAEGSWVPPGTFLMVLEALEEARRTIAIRDASIKMLQDMILQEREQAESAAAAMREALEKLVSDADYVVQVNGDKEWGSILHARQALSFSAGRVYTERVKKDALSSLVPSVGSAWIWEPEKSHAREEVIVTETRWNGEEWWIESRPARGVTQHQWNSLDRWVEATVFVSLPEPEPAEEVK